MQQYKSGSEDKQQADPGEELDPNSTKNAQPIV
jgi:hypothetical protein